MPAAKKALHESRDMQGDQAVTFADMHRFVVLHTFQHVDSTLNYRVRMSAACAALAPGEEAH